VNQAAPSSNRLPNQEGLRIYNRETPPAAAEKKGGDTGNGNPSLPGDSYGKPYHPQEEEQ